MTPVGYVVVVEGFQLALVGVHLGRDFRLLEIVRVTPGFRVRVGRRVIPAD
jgi:hypothetical protein